MNEKLCEFNKVGTGGRDMRRRIHIGTCTYADGEASTGACTGAQTGQSKRLEAMAQQACGSSVV